MRNTQKDSGKTLQEIFAENGVSIVIADNSRVAGWLVVKEMLGKAEDEKPKLLIFKTCQGLYDDLTSLQHDEKNPSDAAKTPHDVTHITDALRYYCKSRTLCSEAVSVTEPYEDDDDVDYDETMTGGQAETSYLHY